MNQQRRIEGQPAAGFLGRKHKDVVFIRAKAGVLVLPAMPTNLGLAAMRAMCSKFALLGLSLMLATGSAYGQTVLVKANIPFKFQHNWSKRSPRDAAGTERISGQ